MGNLLGRVRTVPRVTGFCAGGRCEPHRSYRYPSGSASSQTWTQHLREECVALWWTSTQSRDGWPWAACRPSRSPVVGSLADHIICLIVAFCVVFIYKMVLLTDSENKLMVTKRKAGVVMDKLRVWGQQIHTSVYNR